MTDAIGRSERAANGLRKMSIIWKDLGIKEEASICDGADWIMSHVTGTGHEPMFDHMIERIRR